MEGGSLDVDEADVVGQHVQTTASDERTGATGGPLAVVEYHHV